MNGSRDAPAQELFREKGHDPEAVHVYENAAGEPVGAMVRFSRGTLEAERKTFRAYRFEGGHWIAGMSGVALPLYRLPDVLAAKERGETVYVQEGEQCVDALARWELPSTTNSNGAGHWLDEYARVLAGVRVVLLPDNDEAGRRHMQKVAVSLHGVVASVRVLELPGLGEKGDLINWIEAGGTRDEFLALADSAPLWSPRATVNDGWEDPIPFGVHVDPDPFPLSIALPPLIRDFVSDVAETVKVDPTAPALLASVVLSAAAGNAFQVRVSEGHVEPNLARFGIVSCPSGERKSGLFRRVARPLDAWMQDQRPEYVRKRSSAIAEQAVFRKMAENFEKKAAVAKDAGAVEDLIRKSKEARLGVPSLPRRPLAYLDDTTPEALVRHMAENGGASAVLSAEARHVADAVLGKHRRDGSTDDSVYLRAHAGDRIDRARVGTSSDGEFLAIDRPSLAVGICMQPDKLEALADRPELTNSGFIPRCNIVQPASLVGERTEEPGEPPFDPWLASEWERIVRGILGERFRIVDLDPNGVTPVELVLDPEATELRRIFFNGIEIRQREGGDLRSSGAFASKAAGEAARLAALFHLFDLSQGSELWRAHEIPIPAATWTLAEKNQLFHLAESTRVLQLAQEDITKRLARRLLDWIARKPDERGIITGTDVVSARITEDVPAGEEVLKWLEERRWIRRVEQQGRGKRATRWEVHPIVLRGPKG